MRGGRYNMNRGVKRGGGHYDSGGGSGNRLDHSNRHNSRFGNNHYNGRGRGGNKRQFSTSIRDNHGSTNDNDGGHYDSRNRNSDMNHNRHDSYQYRRGRDNSRERNNERKRLRHDDYRTLSSNLSRNNRSPLPSTVSSAVGNSYRSSIGLGGNTNTSTAAATTSATSNNRGESNRRVTISRTSNRYRTRGHNAGQTVRIVRRGAITKTNSSIDATSDLRMYRRKYMNIQNKDRNKLIRASSRLSRNSQIKISNAVSRKRKSESRDAQTKKRKSSSSPYRRSSKQLKSVGITKATSNDIDDKKVSSGDETTTTTTTKSAIVSGKEDLKSKASNDTTNNNDNSSGKSVRSPKSYGSAERETTNKKDSCHDAKKSSKENSNHQSVDYDERKDKERSRKSIGLSKDMSDNNQRTSIEKNEPLTKSAIQVVEPSIKSDNKTDFRTVINLTCVHCQSKYPTFKQYADHLHSYSHKAALKEVAMRQRLYLLGLRTRQRSVQRIIEKNNKEEYEPKFCHLCRLHYRLPQAKHQLSEHHKYMKNFLMPYCAPCRLAFKSPMSFEMHRSTIDHLKCQAYNNTGNGSDNELTIREIDLNNFVTVDSVGEIDLDKKHGKTMVSEELKQKLKDQAKHKDAVSLELAKNEEKPMGAQYIKYIAAYYCEICDVLAEANDDLKTDVVRHCAERKHQMNFTKRKVDVSPENTEKIMPKDEKKNEELVCSEKTAAQKSKHLEDALDLDDDEKLWASLEKDLGDLLEAVPDDLDDTEEDVVSAIKRKPEVEEEEDEAVLNIHIGSFSEFFKDELRKDVDETVIKKEPTPSQSKPKDIKRIKSVSVNKIEPKD